MTWTSAEIMNWIENTCPPQIDEHYEALDKISRALELYDDVEESWKNTKEERSDD